MSETNSDSTIHKLRNKTKDLGQVFTPEWLTEKVLNEADFTRTNITRATRILEPSFGAGVFLYAIINRLVQWGNSQNMDTENLTVFIDESVHGVEYDSKLFNKTIKELKQWALTEHELNLQLPNLYNQDALDYSKYGTFDFVVGNPPYVRIHNLDQDMRDKIKPLSHSTGNTDLYVVFYELGIKWLNTTGKLAYIAPNSWLRNSFQSSFRDYLITTGVLSKVVDYGTRKVFPGVSTYTAIAIIHNQANHTEFVYVNESHEDPKLHYKVELKFTTLRKNPKQSLIFVSKTDYEKHIKRTTSSKTSVAGQVNHLSLKDIATVQNGLCTLGDKLFTLTPEQQTLLDIEPQFLKPLVKASTYRGEPVVNKIIFPYTTNTDGRVVGLDEVTLKTIAPNLYKYLNTIKPALLNRALEKNSEWFWYGRTQALQATFKRKLVFSPLVSPKQEFIKAHIMPAGTLLYSGLFITELTDSSYTLEQLKEIVENPEFCNHIKLYGKNMNGGYKNAGSPLIKSFIVT